MKKLRHKIKVRLQKHFSRLKSKLMGKEENDNLKRLKEHVQCLEVENDTLKDKAEDLITNEQTFHGNRFSGEIRLVYMDLL